MLAERAKENIIADKLFKKMLTAIGVIFAVALIAWRWLMSSNSRYLLNFQNPLTKRGICGIISLQPKTMPAKNVTVKAVFKVAEQHVHNFTYTTKDNVLYATCTDGCYAGFDKNPLTLTLTAPENLVYDGNSKEFAFAEGEADAWEAAGVAVPRITYLAEGDTEPLTEAPKNAGRYIVRISGEEDAAVVEYPFTIDPAKLPELIFTEGKAPTENEAGFKGYYENQDEGAEPKFFEDENGENPIEDLEAWKAEGGNGYLAATGEPSNPQTGDSTNLVLWIAIAAASALGAVICIKKRR